ncbi:MAG: hypothetical protein ABIC96_00345 [Patescibacteria group bacterium]
MESYFSNEIAVTAIIITWFIYRFGIWSKRISVLNSIQKELELHKDWVNPEYTTNVSYDPSWKDLGYVVFKISTVAIDNAITQGNDVLLNKDLLESLIGYRQRVVQFNQLIDEAINFQSNPELWDKPTKKLQNRMLELTCQVHWYGIGDSKQPLTHTYLKLTKQNLQKELDSKFIPLIWLITNINFFGIKKTRIWRYI